MSRRVQLSFGLWSLYQELQTKQRGLKRRGEEKRGRRNDRKIAPKEQKIIC
jgi:hypothetical protein